jgi:hypothetical protein
MGLTLCNNYPVKIWTSIMFYSPETCGGDGGNFEMMGWWGIDPGSCAFVFANSVGDLNRWWYIFGMADDGNVWAGPFGANVPRSAFGGDQACWGSQKVGPDMIRIGYREHDFDEYDNVTLTFVP